MSFHFIVISLVVKFCKGILHLHLVKDILAAVAKNLTFIAHKIDFIAIPT